MPPVSAWARPGEAPRVSARRASGGDAEVIGDVLVRRAAGKRSRASKRDRVDAGLQRRQEQVVAILDGRLVDPGRQVEEVAVGERQRERRRGAAADRRGADAEW